MSEPYYSDEHVTATASPATPSTARDPRRPRVGGRMARTPVSVTVLHTCVIDGTPTDHEAPVEVREIRRVTLGLRYHGVRCDGSAIEWVEGA